MGSSFPIPISNNKRLQTCLDSFFWGFKFASGSGLKSFPSESSPPQYTGLASRVEDVDGAYAFVASVQHLLRARPRNAPVSSCGESELENDRVQR